jgi:hypothetical protein
MDRDHERVQSVFEMLLEAQSFKAEQRQRRTIQCGFDCERGFTSALPKPGAGNGAYHFYQQNGKNLPNPQPNGRTACVLRAFLFEPIAVPPTPPSACD